MFLANTSLSLEDEIVGEKIQPKNVFFKVSKEILELKRLTFHRPRFSTQIRLTWVQKRKKILYGNHFILRQIIPVANEPRDVNIYEYAADVVKGASKFQFIPFVNYFPVVIILFSTGLYKSAFCAYFFGKTRFSSFWVVFFHVSISFIFSFSFFCSMFLCSLNSMSSQKT